MPTDFFFKKKSRSQSLFLNQIEARTIRQNNKKEKDRAPPSLTSRCFYPYQKWSASNDYLVYPHTFVDGQNKPFLLFSSDFLRMDRQASNYEQFEYLGNVRVDLTSVDLEIMCNSVDV